MVTGRRLRASTSAFTPDSRLAAPGSSSQFSVLGAQQGHPGILANVPCSDRVSTGKEHIQ